MKYYSTNHQAPDASLQEAVVKGLASDKGLYMPEVIQSLPQSFYDNIENLSFQEIAYQVDDALFGESDLGSGDPGDLEAVLPLSLRF